MTVSLKLPTSPRYEQEGHVVEGTNVVTGLKCNKVTSVITFGHKCK